MPETTGHVPTVRAAALTNYVPVARSLGLDGPSMLREFGIEPKLLDGGENRIPASAVSRLLVESARRSDCESFALLLAERREFSSIGPLSLLLRHESSFRTVVQRLITYQRVVSDILELDFAEVGDEAHILIAVSPEVTNRQSIELVMALTSGFLGGAMFGGWRPAEVHFRYPAPGDDSVHRRTFRAPLLFNRPFNGFVVAAATLDRKNAYADPGFVEHAQSYVDLLAQGLPVPSFADQVRASIGLLLPSGAATLSRVARQLGVHPRALQRRLDSAGFGFTDLVEATRGSVASDLLADTDLPISEVAFLAGYSSSGSFSRWFAGKFGRPPREWRTLNRAGSEEKK
jgi:AraC-like DNA-binding protein